MGFNLAMKKLLLLLALCLTPAPAFAQCTGVFQPNTICGNLGVTPGVPTQNPAQTIGGSGTIIPPQGRLTLLTNTPRMTTTQANIATLRYDCYQGNSVPYYNGTQDIIDTIASCEVTDAMVSAASAGQIVSGNVYDLWWVHGGANRICAAMSASTGGGGGWSSDTAGSNTARGTGYTQLDITSRSYITNKNAITNCFNAATNYGPVTANQATYLATFYATANGQTSFILGASASGGTAGLIGVWNYYGRVTLVNSVVDIGASYTYTTATTRQARASAGNQVQIVIGVAEDDVTASTNGRMLAAAANSALPTSGVGVDSLITFACQPSIIVQSGAGATLLSMAGVSTCGFNPGVGLHTISANELGDGTNANTFDFSSLNTLITVTRY